MRRFPLASLWYERFAYILLLLVAFGLRAWQLGEDELWFDEAGSVFIARKSLFDLWRYSATAISEHPPLYYTLLHYWRVLAGESEFAIRFLSLLFGMGFVLLLGKLASEVGGRKLAFAAVAIGTIAPFPIAYSQEARMYSLVMALGALLLIAVNRIIRGRPHPRRHLGIVAIASVLGIATSYFFVPVIFVAGIVLVFKGNTLSTSLRRSILLLYGIGALIVLGITFLPGPRSTLQQLLQMSGGIPTYIPKLLQAWGDISGQRLNGTLFPTVAFAVTWGWVGFGAWKARHSSLPLWLFWVAVWGLIIILPVLDGRYFSAAMAVPYLWMGIALRHIVVNKPVAWVAFPLLLGAIVFPLWHHYDRDYGYFGQGLEDATRYIRGPQDSIIISEPDSWPQIEYYGSRSPMTPTIHYFPTDRTIETLTPELVEPRLAIITQSNDRIVLGPINPKNRDKDSLIENYLLTHAFAVSRTFYPDSTLVALFVSELPLTLVSSDLPFGNDINVDEVYLSNTTLSTGEALRVRLVWQANRAGLPRATVSLQLQDEQGRVWANQQSEPCNGWCATIGWEPGQTITDNRALLIPDDIPAGRYALVLRLDTAEGVVGTPATLGAVQVERGQNFNAPATAPDATIAGVEIRNLSVTPTTLRVGDTLLWDAQWRPTATSPDGWQLLWELVQNGNVAQRWQQAPSTEPYPSAGWQLNQPMRGINTLTLLGTLVPGPYQLRVRVINAEGTPIETPLFVTDVTVVDRPRLFDIPDVGIPVTFEWQQGVYLRRLELPPTVTYSDGLPITLAWQASGALDRSYKEFIQVRDATGQIVAQQDIYPANGGALTNTWATDEVVVDEIKIDIPLTVPANTEYQVVLGWYHLESGERLPVIPNGNEVILGSVRLVEP
jgi:hypothetical protein